MQSLVLWPVLNEISLIGLTFAFLSVVFFFFYVKGKFNKTATVKTYSILFFAFVFYAIAAFSFVFLNALNTFFNLDQFFLNSYWWFLPFSLSFSLFGVIISFLLYFIGQKLFKEFVFKAMNLSLLILLPSLVYYMFLWPFKSITLMVMPSANNHKEQIEINVNGFDLRYYNAGKNYNPAEPSEIFDSLSISKKENNRILFVNNTNGFSYEHQIPLSGISQLYVAPSKHNKQLAVLALSPSIVGNAVLIVCDSMGTKIYQNKFEESINRMSISEDGNYLLLQKYNELDSLVFFACLQLKP